MSRINSYSTARQPLGRIMLHCRCTGDSLVPLTNTGYPYQFSHFPLRCSGQVSAQGSCCVQGHHIQIQCGYASSFFVLRICCVTSNLWIPVRLDLLEQLKPCNQAHNYLTKLTSLSKPNSSLDKLFVLCFILKIKLSWSPCTEILVKLHGSWDSRCLFRIGHRSSEYQCIFSAKHLQVCLW